MKSVPARSHGMKKVLVSIWFPYIHHSVACPKEMHSAGLWASEGLSLPPHRLSRLCHGRGESSAYMRSGEIMSGLAGGERALGKAGSKRLVTGGDRGNL